MIKQFLKEEKASAYYWAIALIGMVLVGILYVSLDFVEDFFYDTFSVEQGLGTDQRTFFHSVWTYGIPIGVMGLLMFWAMVQSQKRRGM